MRIFLAFIRIAYQKAAIYRFEFWTRIIAVFVMMYGMLSLWKTLLNQGSKVLSGIPLEQMPTYGAIGMLIPSLLYAAYGIRHYIARRVRSGKLRTNKLHCSKLPTKKYRY